MEQIGYVVETGDTIKVRVMRESACGGNCGACHGCPSEAVLITYPNEKDNPFEIGEQVVIEMSATHFLRGTFGSYGVMTVCMLTGAILGYVFSKQEIVSIAGGFAGLMIGAVFMRLLFGRHTQTLKIKRQNEERKQ